MAIKLKAIKIKQTNKKGKAIYMASVPVENLIDESYFKVDWWDNKKMGSRTQGYQRRPAENRLKKIGKYLESITDPTVPTSILVNSRENEISFKNISGNTGDLVVEPYPCYIVDGQTRIEGFRYAIKELHLDLANFELPVIFLSNFNHYEEIEQFYILNTTQKRVSTDLAQRLKMEMKLKDQSRFDALSMGEKWELQALTLIDQLNQKPDSQIWKGRIRLPNTKKSSINLVNQNSFVQSLRPLYKGGLLESARPEKAYELIRDYWEALSRIFPDAFNKPREYVIQKTPGLFSLHDLANRVFNKLNADEKKINLANLIEILGKVFQGEKDYFWHTDNDIKGAARAGSMKGFTRLAEDFQSNLEKIS